MDVIKVSEEVLSSHKINYIKTATWTTAGFYRECAEMVEYRKSEGCQVVDMECASLAALCKFRGMRYGQLLYSGDILFDTENYNDRDRYSDIGARELLFRLCLEILRKL